MPVSFYHLILKVFLTFYEDPQIINIESFLPLANFVYFFRLLM